MLSTYLERRQLQTLFTSLITSIKQVIPINKVNISTDHRTQDSSSQNSDYIFEAASTFLRLGSSPLAIAGSTIPAPPPIVLLRLPALHPCKHTTTQRQGSPSPHTLRWLVVMAHKADHSRKPAGPRFAPTRKRRPGDPIAGAADVRISFVFAGMFGSSTTRSKSSSCSIPTNGVCP